MSIPHLAAFAKVDIIRPSVLAKLSFPLKSRIGVATHVSTRQKVTHIGVGNSRIQLRSLLHGLFLFGLDRLDGKLRAVLRRGGLPNVGSTRQF